jgi:diacylglycerol kinase (ATP)
VLTRAEHHRHRADAPPIQLLAAPHVPLLNTIKSAIVIANPASRRGRRLAGRAQQELSARSIECDLVFTERPGHAAELAASHAHAYDAVFVVGGDGTVMEVAAALAAHASETPIGVLAGGTGNLVARAFGIPLSVTRAVPALLDGDERRIDLGRLGNGGGFSVAAGVGIDAAMIAETPGWLKRRLGVLAYTIIGARAALRTVVGRDFFTARITVDGVVHERRAAMVMIANVGAVLGERLVLGPEIRPDDGMLDACVFSPNTMRDALRIVRRMVLRDFDSDPAVLYVSGRHIRVETDPPRLWQADGDVMGTTPFEAAIEPLAVRLLVPRRG